MGRRARPWKDGAASKAHDGVLGYTVANDVSARDQQRKGGQWTRAKGHDTFCPLGPWIETALDPSDVEIRTEVDGEGKSVSYTHTRADVIVLEVVCRLCQE